jgi:hypothetical protein
LGMELSRFLFLGFTMAFPKQVLLKITGQKSEKNPDHEGVVDHSDSGQGIRNEVERVDQVHEAEESAQQGAGGPLAVAAGEEIAEHAGSGPDQFGNTVEFGDGTKGIHR